MTSQTTPPPSRASRRRRRFRPSWGTFAALIALVLALSAVHHVLDAGAGARLVGATGSRPSRPVADGTNGARTPTRTSAAAGVPAAAYSPQHLPPAWSGPLPYPIIIADSGNDRILEVTPQKQIVWQYPGPQTSALSKSYGTSGDDAFFSPNGQDIITNDEDQGTIIRIDYATRQVTWHFGVPGDLGGGNHLLNYPDDAYLLPDGNTIVADIRNCRELTISGTARIIRSFGVRQSGYCRTDPAKGLYGYPNGDTPLANGDILMSFISGDQIALVSANGRVIWDTTAPDLYGGYVSDAQPLPDGDVLVASYGKPGMLIIFNPRTHQVVWQYRVTSGPGELDHPSLALPLPNGNILLNDDRNQRVIVIDPHSDQIVWQYGSTGVAGKSAGLLNVPDGVEPDYWHDWKSFLARGAAPSNAAAGGGA